MKQYPGLILGQQTPVAVDTKYWRFGTIRNGKRVVDNNLHYTSYSLGYDDHGIIDRVCGKLKKFKPETGDNVFKSFEPTLNSPHFELQNKINNMSNGYNSLFSLSGSDGMETAIKLAFAYQFQTNNTRKQIVAFDDAYHGATLLTLSCGGQGFDGFYNMNPYDSVIKINQDFDLDDVDWADVACILVETCPHHETMSPYNVEVFKKIAKIQQEYDVLVIVDDIFMGGGKTGDFFGFNDLPISPDIFVQAKAITGGFFPLAVTCYNKKVQDVVQKQNWYHGHTYSFSLSGVLSMLEYIKVLEEKNYMSKVPQIISDGYKSFAVSNFEIVGNYGTSFLLKFNKKYFRFCIPLNADEEYYTALPYTFSELEKLWNQ